MKFWNNKKSVPLLSSIALSHVTIPATSVPCERLFSSAGHAASAIRYRLSAEHLSQILFLKALEITEWHF